MSLPPNMRSAKDTSLSSSESGCGGSGAEGAVGVGIDDGEEGLSVLGSRAGVGVGDTVGC